MPKKGFMPLRPGPLAAVWCCFLFLPSCPPVAPDAFDPAGLDFTFRVQEDGSGITATALIGGAEADPVSGALEAGDTLTVNGVPLEFDGVRYKANLKPAPTYVFLFQPAGGPAYRSSVDAPPPARILYPAQGDQLSRSEGFIARWDNRGAGANVSHDVELDLGITCNVVATVRDIDEERYAFNPDALIRSVDGSEGMLGRTPDLSCDGVIARSLLFVYARNPGTMDPALVGDISAVVESSVLFTTLP